MELARSWRNTFGPTLLKSRVARRIFIQFVLCAIVPILTLGIISFIQVTHQLRSQGQARLINLSKTTGIAVFDRLSILEDDFQNLSFFLQNLSPRQSPALPEPLRPKLSTHLKSMALLDPRGRTIPLLGNISPPLSFSQPQQKHLEAGKSLLVTFQSPKGFAHVYMARYLQPRNPAKGILVGEVDIKYLLGLSEYNTLPYKTGICVLGENGQILFASIRLPPGSYHKAVAKNSSGFFEWTGNRKTYLAGFWTIPLKYYFFSPGWTIIMSQPETYIFSPAAYFKKTFPLVILLALAIVAFISLVQIRRTLLPLQALRKHTRSIGTAQFTDKIRINTNDEFQDLAESFNQMAEQLGTQFRTITIAAEIDRAILSSLETARIARIALTRMSDLFRCDTGALILAESGQDKQTAAYALDQNKAKVNRLTVCKIPLSDIERICGNSEHRIMRIKEMSPQFMDVLPEDTPSSFAVFPIRIRDKLAGILMLGPSDFFEKEKDSLSRAQMLANQVAVALSNARLVEELSDLNWGTLHALARTVDAKSPWTAGHSERVTWLALRIGRAMGLTSQELEDIHRGGLLHDIGKIGVPASVIDKPGKLSPAEWQVIKQHPRLGAKIVEPISAYKRITPMILHHHERYDGMGYPDGISGHDISLYARIISVADAYDAMVSDRPYRKAMTQDQAIRILQMNSGTQFDPDIVDVFVTLLCREDTKPPTKRASGMSS